MPELHARRLCESPHDPLGVRIGQHHRTLRGVRVNAGPGQQAAVRIHAVVGRLVRKVPVPQINNRHVRDGPGGFHGSGILGDLRVVGVVYFFAID